MIHLKYILFVSILLIGLNSFAQKDSIKYGKIEVKVIEEMTKKTIEFAVITIQSKTFKKSKYSDYKGNWLFDSVPKGSYEVTVQMVGYLRTKITEVVVLQDSIKKLYVSLIDKKSRCMDCPVPQNLLIKQDKPTQQYLNSKQIMRMTY